MACATAHFFHPTSWGSGEGPKGQIIIKFQLQSQFQRFLNQTLRDFSQMKDIKHIRQDFYPDKRFMPQGWDLGQVLGVLGDQTGDLGLGQKDQISLHFFKSMGICDGAPSNVF